jgi:hypothetical protein
MMTAALLLTLLTARVDVIAVQAGFADAPAHTALAQALAQDEVLDASVLYRALFKPSGMLPLQDFEAFTQAPIEGWPPPLADTWRAGVAYCRELAGPPPWSPSERTALTTAMSCGDRLSAFLWQRYLDFAKPQRVIVLELQGNGAALSLKGTTYQPSATDQLKIESPLPKADPGGAVDRVLKALLSGEGPREPRTVSTALFTALAADPFAAEQAITTPVATAKSCESLPIALSVSGDGATAKTLVARWAATAKGKGPPATCSLAFSEHPEPPHPGAAPHITTLTTVLRCGNDAVSAEVAKDLVGKPLERISERLVQKLAARWCR